MKTKQIIIMALALGISASSIVAQNPERPRGPRPPGEGRPGEGPRPGHERRLEMHRMPPPLITALDADHDGKISSDEMANSANALKTLDKNADGQLTAEELHPPRPEGAPGGERKGPPQRPQPPQDDEGGPRIHKRIHMPPPPMLKALDANDDKTISADEIGNASKSLLTLDKNSDGQLTLEELRPEPPARPPGNN